MHPDTYVFLAGERIADIRRDADRRRLTSQIAHGARATIHHRESSTAVAPAPIPTPLTGRRGAG